MDEPLLLRLALCAIEADMLLNSPKVVVSLASKGNEEADSRVVLSRMAVAGAALMFVFIMGLPGFTLVQAAHASLLVWQAHRQSLLMVEANKKIGAASVDLEKAPDEAQKEHNKLPAHVEAFLAKAKNAFEANLSSDVTVDGKPWSLLTDAGGIKISQAEFPGQVRWPPPPKKKLFFTLLLCNDGLTVANMHFFSVLQTLED